jgi:hypothetical protein
MKRFLLPLFLAACSQPCPTPQGLAVKQWSSAEQYQILAEEKKLPADSILIGVLEDYAKLRREVR